jgi:citrate lyase subunit beta/citryl-CoA lyase
MKNKGVAGNHGDSIRSDCKISIELKDKGGIDFTLHSKVAALYSNSQTELIKDILHFYNIQNANIILEDSGALNYVIAARTEGAIKQVSNTRKEYLLPLLNPEDIASSKERFRMSRLYLPGNTPSMMINAGIHNPQGIILDLEDSVAPEKKDEARILVRNALRNIDFYGAERMVRINQLPLGLEDAAIIVPHQVDLLLIPKCEELWQIHEVEKVIKTIVDSQGLNRSIYLMPIIESALGIENAFKIASGSKNVVAMAIGLEDFTADLGVTRTSEGKESLYARSRIVNACKAARIQAIDSVYSDVADMKGLLENVKASRALGFEGMGCIHPGQIRVIHEGYMPDSVEIEKAKNIVNAYKEAREKGLGVVSLGSKMIDAPVVKQAEKILDLVDSLRRS